jgi:hypothetical protein
MVDGRKGLIVRKGLIEPKSLIEALCANSKDR